MLPKLAKAVMNGVLALSLLAPPALVAADPFKISYPANNEVVSGNAIVLEGSGASAGASIEVKVMTDQWYVQTGKADIQSDGAWTYGPCYIKGEGEYSNHTIKATLVKDGRPLGNATVRGVTRK